MSRHMRWYLIMMIGIAALIVTGLPGCGGDDNGGTQEDDTGSVAGVVQYWDGTPLENIRVTVGGQSAYSDSSGDFLITGIAEGDNQVLTVALPEWLTLPTDEPILVNVYANRPSTLSDTMVLFDVGARPPDPPED